MAPFAAVHGVYRVAGGLDVFVYIQGGVRGVCTRAAQRSPRVISFITAARMLPALGSDDSLLSLISNPSVCVCACPQLAFIIPPLRSSPVEIDDDRENVYFLCSLSEVPEDRR
ncbi:hypothetical protein WN55_10831 [Dufourea novaeangliae]|uniref:Uncharacterized protein n=1 Tax=Dufourea novaeangliae TaxID=178035 RepID=A0A154P9K4_DUFNO|nr:hypothetical protein WN55_10831 [Dufourea novaeangliae]